MFEGLLFEIVLRKHRWRVDDGSAHHRGRPGRRKGVVLGVFNGSEKGDESHRDKLDDLVLDMIEEPIIFAITVVGIWFGLSRLEFPESVEGWIWNGIQFLIVLSVTWLIARLLNSFFSLLLTPLAEKSENDLDDQLLPIVRKGTTFTVWALGIIVA